MRDLIYDVIDYIASSFVVRKIKYMMEIKHIT